MKKHYYVLFMHALKQKHKKNQPKKGNIKH